MPLLFLFEEKHTVRNFFTGLLAGFVFHAFLLNWIFSVAGFFYLLLAFYLAINWAIFFSLVFALPEKTIVPVSACLWYFLEILRRFVLTGFPWLPFSLSQWNNPAIAGTVSIYGSAGLSCLIVAFNISFYRFLRRRGTISIPVILIIMIVSYAVSTIFAEYRGKTNFVSVAAIQGNTGYFGQAPEESFEKYRKLTDSIRWNPEIVVWPESSYPSIIDWNGSVIKYLKRKSFDFPVLVGTMSEENGNIYNSACLFNKGKIFRYHKTHLVPFGEYVPARHLSLIRKIYLRFAGGMPEIKPGSVIKTFEINDKNFSALICFENIFPEITAESARNQSEFFVVITNDSWYGNSFGPYQHFAHNIFRACETGRYVIQVSTTGLTGIVSNSGRFNVFQKNGKELFVDGIMNIRMQKTNDVRTIYTALGEIGISMIFLIITGVCLCRD